MDQLLRITHCKTRDLKPLAIIHNFPGLYAEMTPAQLRGMALALEEAAQDCERLQMQTGRSCPQSREYRLLESSR